MVPPPFNNPNFVLGTFNNALRPSLRVEICELEREPLAVPGVTPPPAVLPIASTLCKRLSTNPNVFAAPVKTFPAGSVNLVNLPRRENGWWSLFNLPPDGFYYVLWNTRQSDLDVNKFYRIKVLLEGSTAPLGVADVDPMSSLGQWRHSKTGHVVQMVDNFLLPIAFRIEQGALCAGENHCTSVSVPNNNPNAPETIVSVDGGAGVIGGASFPNGWLRSGSECPEGTPCPQSVVVTITEVPSGETEGSRNRTIPCHVGLPLQQFNKCFQFTTTPELALIDGAQFARDVTVAVCYVLQGTGDPRARFAQLYSSGPNEPAHVLPEVDDSGILGAGARNCTLGVIGFRSSNPVTQFATTGWRTLKGFFGVQTAYALDAGLGGLVKRFSNIGSALTAAIEGFPAGDGEGPIQLSLSDGVAIGRARIVGSRTHAGETPGAPEGINSVPVTFSVASGNGTLRALNDEGGANASVTVLTGFFSSLEADGIASVEWTPPTVPGTYTMTATGPTTNGPVAFSVTVPPVVGFNDIAGPWFNENEATGEVVSVNMGPTETGFVVQAWGQCSPWDCDFGVTNGSTANWNSAQEITAVWDQGYATRTQTITYLSPSRIRVVMFSDFTVTDGRPDRTSTEFFTRPALSRLARAWVNQASTGVTITRIQIGVEGNAASVNTRENCGVEECDWGVASAVTSSWNTTHRITASWTQGTVTRTQTIQLLSHDYIRVETFTDYQPGDERQDNTVIEYFRNET